MVRGLGEQPRKRQARGRDRINQILLAAAEVFDEVGYESATTNAIAARAGISPGSLYQFFSDKDDIAHALAEGYALELGSVRSGLQDRPAGAGIETVARAAVRSIIAFNLAHPGFKALFARADMPPSLRDAVAPVNERLHETIRTVLGDLVPTLSPERIDVTTVVILHTVRALIPPIVAASEPLRSTLAGELERIVVAYVASVAASAEASDSAG